MTLRTLAAAAALLPGAVFAQEVSGDAAAGEQQFGRQCVACHVVANAAGEVLAGRNAQTGPNLFEIVGRQPGAMPDFDYSEAMTAYGETGVVWEEANLVSYLLDPTAHLREALGDDSARSKMAYKVREESQALDLVAYLASFGVTEGEGGEDESGEAGESGEGEGEGEGEGG